jgi:hypothetical protein
MKQFILGVRSNVDALITAAAFCGVGAMGSLAVLTLDWYINGRIL